MSFVNYRVSVRSWMGGYQTGHWRASLDLLTVKAEGSPAIESTCEQPCLELSGRPGKPCLP